MNSNRRLTPRYLQHALLVTLAVSFYFFSSISLTVFNKWLFTESAAHRELDEKRIMENITEKEYDYNVAPPSANVVATHENDQVSDQSPSNEVQSYPNEIDIDLKDVETYVGSEIAVDTEIANGTLYVSKRIWCVVKAPSKEKKKKGSIFSWFSSLWYNSRENIATQSNELRVMDVRQCKGRNYISLGKLHMKDLMGYNLTVPAELMAEIKKVHDRKKASGNDANKFENRILGVSPYNFHFPLTVTFFHQIMVWIYVLIFNRIKVFRSFIGEIERSNDALWTLFPIGFICGMDWGLSNTSIRYVPLSLYEMIKGASPVVVLLFSFTMKLITPSPLLVLIILLISFGVILSVTGGNFTFTAEKLQLKGLILLLIATFLSGTRVVLAQYALQQGPLFKHFEKLVCFPLGFLFRRSHAINTNLSLTKGGANNPPVIHASVTHNKNNSINNYNDNNNIGYILHSRRPNNNANNNSNNNSISHLTNNPYGNAYTNNSTKILRSANVHIMSDCSTLPSESLDLPIFDKCVSTTDAAGGGYSSTICNNNNNNNNNNDETTLSTLSGQIVSIEDYHTGGLSKNCDIIDSERHQATERKGGMLIDTHISVASNCVVGSSGSSVSPTVVVSAVTPMQTTIFAPSIRNNNSINNNNINNNNNKGPYNTLTAIYYAAPASALALIIPACVLEGPEIMAQWPLYTSPQKEQLIGYITAASVIAFFLSISEFLVTKLTSALTICVAGIAKQVFIIAIAMVIFGESVGGVNIVGFLMSLLGIAMYNGVKFKRNASFPPHVNVKHQRNKHFKETSDQIA